MDVLSSLDEPGILREEVRVGRSDEDLFYRLNVFPVRSGAQGVVRRHPESGRFFTDKLFQFEGYR